MFVLELRLLDVLTLDGPVIINVWKVQLGETGRGDLKRDISERISAFPYLKPTVNAVSKIKTATVDQLVVISEIVGLLKKVRTRFSQYRESLIHMDGSILGSKGRDLVSCLQTLRIAQRYELERTPFIRLLSAKRQHRPRVAVSISTALPAANSAPYSGPDEAATQRRAPRPVPSTRASLPPAKMRRRGTVLSKAAASCAEETLQALPGHGPISPTASHAAECLAYAMGAESEPSLLVTELISSLGGGKLDCIVNPKPGNMGGSPVRHRGALDRPARCHRAARVNSEGMSEACLNAGEEASARCPPAESAGEADGSCFSYFLKATAPSQVKTSHNILPSSGSSPLDDAAGATKDLLTNSIGVSSHEGIHSWLTNVLDNPVASSQLRGIVSAMASKWTHSGLRPLQTAQGSHGCATADPNASVSSCPNRSEDSATSGEDHRSVCADTGNTVAIPTQQSRLRPSRPSLAGHFEEKGQFSDSLWKLAVGELAVASNTPTSMRTDGVAAGDLLASTPKFDAYVFWRGKSNQAIRARFASVSGTLLLFLCNVYGAQILNASFQAQRR